MKHNIGYFLLFVVFAVVGAACIEQDDPIRGGGEPSAESCDVGCGDAADNELESNQDVEEGSEVDEGLDVDEDSDADDGSDVDEGSDADGGDVDDDPGADQGMPMPYCAPVADWPQELADMEEEVLALVNQHRAQGTPCSMSGDNDPSPPLQMSPALRCAARLHSMDMVERDFRSHDNPDGEGPLARMRKVGFTGVYWGENIAGGHYSARAVVEAWMSSTSGHCENIMNSRFKEMGVGLYDYHWTQKFIDP